MRILSWDHAVFALTLIALGILGLDNGDFDPTCLPATASALDNSRRPWRSRQGDRGEVEGERGSFRGLPTG